MESNSTPVDVLMVGTGEYTTGYVGGKQSASDKKVGVIALCMFDMQTAHRGSKVRKAKMVGTNGTKFPGIRDHLKKNIEQVYSDMKTDFESFPADDQVDPKAFVKAIQSMRKGDAVTIVTPDETHFEIAKTAIEHGLHVLLTKPPVKVLKEQIELVKLAAERNVLVSVEYHKRWDPMYSDARERIRALGDFGFFQSYMSQPKFQLHTFSQWAGTGSDISYYLNSHHVDFHCWAMQGIARPTRIVAMKSTGVANSAPFNCPPNTEDTITIMAQWENLSSGNVGTAVYTSSWTAPKSDVHTQQRFFYMGHKGEINIDQAHRGYTVTTDENGYSSANPLYMKYTKDTKGRFAGQGGYGYRSVEAFVDAVNKVRSGAKPEEFDNELATAKMTLTSTAIVEAGRRSLDNNGKAFIIKYDPENKTIPVAVEQE